MKRKLSGRIDCRITKRDEQRVSKISKKLEFESKSEFVRDTVLKRVDKEENK